mgnify:CR=1 FL=1
MHGLLNFFIKIVICFCENMCFEKTETSKTTLLRQSQLKRTQTPQLTILAFSYFPSFI